MFCANCGTVSEGQFCGSCGAVLSQQPAGSQSFAPLPVKKKSSKTPLMIVLSVLMAIGLVGTISFTASASREVTSRESAVARASSKIAEFNAEAEDYDSKAARDSISRDNCYANWYCTSATYSLWVSLVNGWNNLAEDARAEASKWQSSKRLEQGKLATALVSRTVGIALSVFFGLAMAASIALSIIFATRQRKQLRL